MSKQQPVEWISEEAAAAMVGLSPAWFARRVREGSIQVDYTKPSWKLRLYSKASIEAYIVSCSTLQNKKAGSLQPANY